MLTNLTVISMKTNLEELTPDDFSIEIRNWAFFKNKNSKKYVEMIKASCADKFEFQQKMSQYVDVTTAITLANNLYKDEQEK